MTLQFPKNPSNGQQFTASNNLIYVWDGEKWITTGSAQAAGDYVNRTGDVMTGQLGLPGGGSAADAIQKQEVQSLISAIPAPDLTPYVEKAGSTMTGDLTVPSLNGGALAGFRSALINGGLDVQQRSGSIVGGNGFVTDRWYAGSSTPSDVNTATATFPGTEFARCVRIGNGIGARNVFKQPIELPAPWVGGKAGVFTPGSTWTFSFYHDPDTAAPADPQFAFAANSGGANAVAENLAAFTDVIGDTASGWQRKSVTFTIGITPNAGNICAYVQFTGNNTWCAGFQLEPGPVCTPFEQRFVQTDLALCQRYFQTYSGIGMNITSSGDTYRNAQSIRPVEMRVKPTEVAAFVNATFDSTAASTTKYLNISTNPINKATESYMTDYTADAEL